MKVWTLEEIRRTMDVFSGASDPGDPKERKRLRILAAATKLFEHYGYRKTSIDEVARKSGVAKGTIYLYFKTKGDLLVQAIVEEKKKYMGRMAPIFSGDVSGKERLRELIHVGFLMAHEMPLTSRLISGDQEILVAMQEASPELMQKSEGIRLEYLIDIVDAAAAPHELTREELTERAKVFSGIFLAAGMLTDERVRGGLSLERFSATLATLLVDGVAPKPLR